jgi:hypothetical protein
VRAASHFLVELQMLDGSTSPLPVTTTPHEKFEVLKALADLSSISSLFSQNVQSNLLVNFQLSLLEMQTYACPEHLRSPSMHASAQDHSET